jgi:hypothetical protein|tara:strand:+ start:3811 stop:4605 length:795 start_codon:yes stop_codon:yes gene_type:complete
MLLPYRPPSDNALNMYYPIIVPESLPGTYKFWGNDDKELYENNLAVQDFGWRYRTQEIQYKLNSQGYRCPEFDTIDWKNSIVIVGCSQVFGIGLAEDETIAVQLQKLTDCPVINLGRPGSSIDYSLANNIQLRTNFPTPRAVINHWTEPMRETYFGVEKIATVTPGLSMHETYYKKHIGMLINMFGLDAEDVEHDYKYKAKMSSDTCKALWKDTTYIESTWNSLTADALDCYEQKKLDTARDIMHWGVDSARALAKHYAELIEC